LNKESWDLCKDYLHSAFGEHTSSTSKVYISLVLNFLKRNVLPDQDWKQQLFGYARNPTKTIELIHEKYPNLHTKATLFSALYKLFQVENLFPVSEFLEAMMVTSANIKDDYKDQKFKPGREDKKKSLEEINSIHDNLLISFHGGGLDQSKKIRLATDVLISGLMSGRYASTGTVPRRLLEYTLLALHSDLDGLNRFSPDKKSMIFEYHKCKKHDAEIVQLNFPEELRCCLDFLSNIRPKRPYLLMNEKNGQFNSSTLHSRLFRIFGFGCDMLRSIFLTDKFKDQPSLLESEKLATEMGHSVNAQQLFYVKK